MGQLKAIYLIGFPGATSGKFTIRRGRNHTVWTGAKRIRKCWNLKALTEPNLTGFLATLQPLSSLKLVCRGELDLLC